MKEPSISDLGLMTLKHGRSYAIFAPNGDIAPEQGMEGLYIDDMRYTGALALTVDGEKPAVTQAEITPDNAELITTAQNAGKTLAVQRSILVFDGLVHQAVTLRNLTDAPLTIPVRFDFASDFVDMFNVRGHDFTKTLGEKKTAAVTDTGVRWHYAGIDGVARESGILFSKAPATLSADSATFLLTLPPHGAETLHLECGRHKPDAAGPSAKSYQDARTALAAERAQMTRQGATLEFSQPALQAWFDRSLNDLALLTTRYDSGLYPCAGIPWFAVPFGRDGLITALETLWAKPDLAKGVLKFLSARQAQEENNLRDAAPGKIMHETRENEMSRAGLVPFGLYYGGTDTTLLYILLAGEYLRQTNDTAFIREIWPNIQKALQWMEDYAEDKNWSPDKAEGFLVYQRKLESGLYNQMWKDSKDSVFYEDGNTEVAFPRAVCEVQGYAYAAWNTGRKLAEIFHEAAKAEHYAEKAETLYRHFNEKFWDKKDGYYYLALDGDKKPCRVQASNMGQLLMTGIVPADRAAKIVGALMDRKFFNGYGIRTVAEGAALYDPVSYHNGSVWPHDTALIARGMGQTGHQDETVRIFEGLLAAAKESGGRLPELFSGTAGQGLQPYSHACSPQAWAAAAPFQLLQAVLGLEVDAARHEVRIDTSAWPAAWGTVKIRQLPVGDKTADIEISSRGLAVLKAPGIAFIDKNAPKGEASPPPLKL